MDLCYQPTTAALFTQCVLTASEAFLFFLISLFLPVFVFFLAAFSYPPQCFRNSSPLRGPFSRFCVALLFSLFFDVHFADASARFLRGAGCRLLATQTLGFVGAVTLNVNARCFNCAMADSIRLSVL